MYEQMTREPQMSKEKGFGVIGIILTIGLVAVLGVVIWRLMNSEQQKQSSQSQDSSQIKQTEPAKRTDPNEGYVVIKEWGVRFKPVEGFEDVEYFKPSNFPYDAFTFTTKSLSDSAASCASSSGNIVLGGLARHIVETEGFGGVKEKIGDYYYQFRGPQASCGTENDALESEALNKLSKSLETLEQAK